MKTAIFLATVLLVGCAQEDYFRSETWPSDDLVIVKASSEMEITVGEAEGRRSAAPYVKPIQITNNAASVLTVSEGKFSIPEAADGILSFGQLQIASLFDNDLRVCGGGDEKCTKALLRVYTTDAPMGGLYNSADDYSAPLMVLVGSLVSIGYEAPNATILSMIDIPAEKNVIRLNDFGAPLKYQIKSDFSNAGSGVYSTTMVLEYALAP